MSTIVRCSGTSFKKALRHSGSLIFSARFINSRCPASTAARACSPSPSASKIGDAEPGEEAVPEVLRHHPVMLFDDPPHRSVDRSHRLPPLFWVELFGERGGPDDIGEQDRDDPAFLRWRWFSRELSFEVRHLPA
jgi:hypothetical protein